MFKFKIAFCLFVITLLIYNCDSSDNYDIIISNGEVYDGSGSESTIADIGIIGSEIVKIGDLAGLSAKRVINAKGLVVSPGFIDVHTHLDPILKLSNCESHLKQGVTTSLGGPDGSSPWPFGKFLDTLDQIGVGMNIGYLIGHNTIRKNVMSLENRAPTKDEMDIMKSQISLAMDEGAFGISTGLKYLPGNFSEIDEIISLSKEASNKGGIYTSHLRDEGLGVIASVKEAIDISKYAEIPVVLTHHKVIGKPMWGKSSQTLALVDSARVAGLDILMDQYPYEASYTGISVLIPGWARAGGNKQFAKRIDNPILRDSIKNGIIFNILNDRGGNDLDRVQFAKVKWMPELEGKTLKYWAKKRGLNPSIENGAELVIEAQLKGGASCVFFAMDKEDVENIMKHPQTMIASDGRLVRPGDGHPHPRWYGTFPRVLGHYVRKKNTLSLSEAIYKMTLLPANTIGLKNRGVLKEGMKADITIFNSNTVIDKATFEKPHQYPEGIYYVMVNGKLSIDDGNFMDIKAGEVLRYNY
jgi:dihydroorotase/N-acyl-D-amino-acid deacylase